MIIYRVCTESNEDGSAFGAKIEVETDSRQELETILKTLGVSGKDNTVCHCNLDTVDVYPIDGRMWRGWDGQLHRVEGWARHEFTLVEL